MSFLLRRPRDQEITQITIDMVTQERINYNLRNIKVGDESGKALVMFIKEQKQKFKNTKKDKDVVNVKEMKTKVQAKKDEVLKPNEVTLASKTKMKEN